MTFEEFQEIVNDNFSRYNMTCSEQSDDSGFISHGSCEKWMIGFDYNANLETYSIDIFANNGMDQDCITLWYCEAKHLNTLTIAFNAVKDLLSEQVK